VLLVLVWVALMCWFGLKILYNILKLMKAGKDLILSIFLHFSVDESKTFFNLLQAIQFVEWKATKFSVGLLFFFLSGIWVGMFFF
jgi:hypothetical protein